MTITQENFLKPANSFLIRPDEDDDDDEDDDEDEDDDDDGDGDDNTSRQYG